jgi:hypothetical protein
MISSCSASPTGPAQEFKGKSVDLEVSLQRLIEANMETLFDVRFLATEYSTGAKHRGTHRLPRAGRNRLPSHLRVQKRVVNSVINRGPSCQPRPET